MYEELYQSIKQRYGAGSSKQLMSEWICNNTTIKRNTPFSFNGYEFQRQIIDDMHPDLSCIKCSQVGLTETQLRKYLGLLTRNDGVSGIFSLPNEDMFKRVYKTRLKPIMDRDEIFNPPTETKPIRSTGLVQIKDSFGYITGCGEDDATSIPADFLMHDEVDLSPEEMIVLYQSRLQNSQMRITQKFSTPTFQGYGIDKDYKLSDQREYEIRCESCNHWQVPLFNRKFVHCPEFEQLDLPEFTDLTAEIIASMDFSETHVRCERCLNPLDLANPDIREWVARYPSRDNFRGYYVRPFSAGRLSPAYIFGQLAKYQKDGFIRRFFNTVLGQAYNSADSQVQRDDVEACMKGGEIPDIGAGIPCFLGIDVGFVCHITVSHDDENGQPVWDLFEIVPVARLERASPSSARSTTSSRARSTASRSSRPPRRSASSPGAHHADPVARNRCAPAAQGRARHPHPLFGEPDSWSSIDSSRLQPKEDGDPWLHAFEGDGDHARLRHGAR
jgi:hypothetical protein